MLKYLQIFAASSLVICCGVLVFTKEKNGVDFFSVSMVDDIIHDKYEKNSNEYYIYRNKKDESSIEKGNKELILYDNLAWGYAQVHESQKSFEVYKKKKAILEALPFDKDNRYRYYANLGTILIHDGMSELGKNKEAKEKVIEGQGYIKKAIEVNVNAHFGRENYQLIAVTWFIKMFDAPNLLFQENFLGKKTLNEHILNQKNTLESCGKMYHDIYPEVKKTGKSLVEQINDSCPMALKGVIGMIRLGGGPNPHSFLTIGDILVAMGEYKTAFASYARSIEMNHPNKENITIFAKKLAQKIYPQMSQEESYEKLFLQYKKDFTVGNDWSQKYLEYQKKIISEGKDPTQTQVYNDFYKKYKKASNMTYERE